MLENLNLSLFSLINATPDSAPWMISLAIFIAKDLITVVPLLAAVLWLWGLTAQRQLVIKIAIALAVSLFVSWTMGHLFPHDRHLGVHWPLDMLGGLLAGMIGCLSAQIIWQAMGHKLYQRLQSWYRFCFALPIRKGWVRD
ncbi:undecaprenyl-diphosphate phosphatase [Escherichia coli]|nr:undecaprenyl-diphosphate phosphatase [Escherichia coli]